MNISFMAPVAASLAMLAYLTLNKRSESYFSPLVWFSAFYVLIFVVRPICGEFTNLDIAWTYMGLSPNGNLVLWTNLVSCLGALSFLAGYHISNNRSGAGFEYNRLPQPEALPWKYVGVVLLLLGPISIYSAIFAGAAQTTGGVEMDRVDGVAINVAQNGYFLDAQFMIIGLCLVLAWRSRFRLTAMMPTVAYLSFRALIGWGRWSIVLTLFALCGLYLYMNQRRWPPVKFVLFSVPLLLAFQALGADRQVLGSVIWGRATENSNLSFEGNPIQKVFDGLDFANFEYLAYVVKHVPESTESFTYGTQYLQIFTEPVPRVLWPGKPVGPPIQMFRLNDYGNFLGLTLSIFGDGWVTFGYLGVVFVCGGYGYIFSRLYSRFRLGLMSPFATLGYIGFAGMFIQFFRDGNIVSLIKFPAVTLAPVMVCFVLSKIKFSALNASNATRYEE